MLNEHSSRIRAQTGPTLRPALDEYIATYVEPHEVTHLRVDLSGYAHITFNGVTDYVNLAPGVPLDQRRHSREYDWQEGDTLTDPLGVAWKVTEIEMQDFGEAILRIEQV